MVRKPLKIQEKNFKKKIFLAIYPGTKSPFLGLKKSLKFYWLQLVIGPTIQKDLKNVGSKYGVFLES